MTNESLEDSLLAVQDDLRSLGVNDALAREVLSYRLLVERMGEEGNNEWWDSIVLTETGRDRLNEVTPKTAIKSRIELAQRVGRKAERDRLPDDTLSLYNLGPTMESLIDAELDGLENVDCSFDSLESLSITYDEPGWAEGLAETADSVEISTGSTIQIGVVDDESELKSRNTLRTILRRCVVAYGQSTKNSLQVPYYTVKR